jgi:hypothetical protein
MSRKILLMAALTVFAVSGLGQSAVQYYQATPTYPVTPSAEPFGGPILVTPNATFTTPPPTAGITDAGRAGISVNSTGVVQGENVNATYATVPGTVTYTPGNTYMPGSQPVVIVPTDSTGAVPTATAPTNDLTPSISVNDSSAVSAPVGVAEAANRYKAEKTAVNARVISNDDVQTMLSNKGGVAVAKNMPPLELNGQPQSAGTQPAPAQSAAQTPAPAPQSAPAIPQGQTAVQTAPPAATSQEQPAAPATEAGATTPQINQNQQSNDAQGGSRLPATSTFLPLLGLMGLASGGFGLWFRRFRK